MTDVQNTGIQKDKNQIENPESPNKELEGSLERLLVKKESIIKKFQKKLENLKIEKLRQHLSSPPKHE